MSKPIIYKDLELTDKFDVAFPDKRIPNGFIDKGKTRVGITYTCFNDNRNFIAVLPSVGIIDDALADYPDLKLFDVQDGITPAIIKKYLESDARYKKIITTPESFGKIIAAAGKNVQWLFDNFFLYLDEVHCYATEMFRENILTLFIHVWKFKDMAMGSATPFPFSDPRIQALQHYKFRYRERFGKVIIIDNSKPLAALKSMIARDRFPGRIHIFFNSVTQIGELVNTTGLKELNIYCRYEETNMINLEEASIYFKERPIQEEYRKYNFYSCRYNEGWDLKDDETATIIMVTDVNLSHTLIGIPYKAFQAAGRMKVTPDKIYHISNNFGITGMRGFEAIQKDWLYNADQQIRYYHEHVGNCKRDKINDNGFLKEVAKKFATFDKDTAVLAHMKVDQFICEEFCKEHYNNIKTIEDTWKSLNYETEVLVFDLAPVITSKKTSEEINKQIIERYTELQANPNKYVFDIATSTLQKYRTDYQLLFEAYEILDSDLLMNLNYNNKAMKAALIEKSNLNAITKLCVLLIDEFKLNQRYPGKYIKGYLQGLYDELGMKKADGSRKLAYAKDLEDYGFILHPCKAENKQGSKVSGFEIVAINISVKSAA